jgi:hypothetical protein
MPLLCGFGGYMKFESKFGIGEIVAYEPHQRSDNEYRINDALLEVQGIYFGMDGKIEYICRYPATGMTAGFSESQLIGDPDFNQETGYEADA